MKIEYLGKKLVKRNEALGMTKGKFYHTLEVSDSSWGEDHNYAILKAIDVCLEMDKWAQEEFGYSAYSIQPSDTGIWFKFISKQHAMEFKLRFSV
jgi:hypothetical protein